MFGHPRFITFNFPIFLNCEGISSPALTHAPWANESPNINTSAWLSHTKSGLLKPYLSLLYFEKKSDSLQKTTFEFEIPENDIISSVAKLKIETALCLIISFLWNIISFCQWSSGEVKNFIPPDLNI